MGIPIFSERRYEMKITYIEHSCFLVETAECYMLFDYYCGDVQLPELDPVKPLLLFNSHAHPDHFSKEIFTLHERYPRSFFVLSADIPVPAAIQPFTCPMLPHEHRLIQLAGGRAAVVPTSADKLVQPMDTKQQEAVFRAGILRASETSMKPHPTSEARMDDKAPDAPNVHSITDASIIDVSIDSLRSNDEGVAFIVRLGDLRIYHAGDLNNWWWDGDVEDQKLADIYHEELERIRGRHFTAAFIPLDPRLNGWWKGIEDFMHYADADRIFPMHNFGEKGLPKKFLALDCAAGYKNRICDVEEPLTRWKL